MEKGHEEGTVNGHDFVTVKNVFISNTHFHMENPFPPITSLKCMVFQMP